MRYWQAAVLGIGCFFLMSWHFTSIALGDDGQVLLLNAATEPVRNGQLEVCGQKFMFGEIEPGKVSPFNTK